MPQLWKISLVRFPLAQHEVLQDSFLNAPNSLHRNVAMIYGFDLVYKPDECCSISRHIEVGGFSYAWVKYNTCVGISLTLDFAASLWTDSQ